ncbi:MAG: AAA family ATPase [Methanosarcinales archaeon]|nr:AAA family ATPase [Methanosarcinales archaeon]
MIITLGGLPGTGTSTVLIHLADSLNARVVSAGEVFRQLAAEHGLSLSEFGEFAKKDDDIDKQLDGRQQYIARESGCFGNPDNHLILEGRLAGRFVDADLKVWLKAPIEARCKRTAPRDNQSYEDALSDTKVREACEANRYMKYYKIDMSDLNCYDLVIDSNKWDQHEICDIIKAALNTLVK